MKIYCQHNFTKRSYLVPKVIRCKECYVAWEEGQEPPKVVIRHDKD